MAVWSVTDLIRDTLRDMDTRHERQVGRHRSVAAGDLGSGRGGVGYRCTVPRLAPNRGQGLRGPRLKRPTSGRRYSRLSGAPILQSSLGGRLGTNPYYARLIPPQPNLSRPSQVLPSFSFLPLPPPHCRRLFPLPVLNIKHKPIVCL